MVTMLAARVALAMPMDADLWVRSTTERLPAPPGVTYARWTRGSSATWGYWPVFKVTEEVTHGGACPANKHSEVFALFAGLMSAMNPMLVLAYAMTAVWLNGSMPI